jgi:hypothetical protein
LGSRGRSCTQTLSLPPALALNISHTSRLHDDGGMSRAAVTAVLFDASRSNAFFGKLSYRQRASHPSRRTLCIASGPPALGAACDQEHCPSGIFCSESGGALAIYVQARD